jgi:hypothetical protein
MRIKGGMLRVAPLSVSVLGVFISRQRLRQPTASFGSRMWEKERCRIRQLARYVGGGDDRLLFSGTNTERGVRLL